MSGRVYIGWLIRVTVMMSVVRCPPERTTLDSRSSQHSKDKLTPTRGLKGSMGEVAMVKPSDGEHTDEIEGDSCYYRCPAPSDPENAEARDMHCKERYDAKPIRSWWFCLVEVFCIHPGVEPTHESGSET